MFNLLNFLRLGAVIASGVSAAFGSYFLKKASAVLSAEGTETQEKMETGSKLFAIARNLLTCPAFYIGGLLYVLASLLSIYLLKVLPYSVVVPLGGLTYIWTMIISARLLHEKITVRKLAGVAVILVGVFLIATS